MKSSIIILPKWSRYAHGISYKREFPEGIEYESEMV